MTYLGSFTPKSGEAFNFAVANFDPPGGAPDKLEEVQEELTDLGVDGRRWRRINRFYAPFRLNTVADLTLYSDGLGLCHEYRGLRGAIGTLAVSLAGVSTAWRNVKITGVAPSARRGILIGAGATSGSAVIVYCTWDMVLV